LKKWECNKITNKWSKKAKCRRSYIDKGKVKKGISKKIGICKCGGLCKTVIYSCSVEAQQDNLDMETECDKM
jgi:hypothetical protein